MLVENRTQAEEQAEIHQVFSNAQRILILWLLESGEMSVGEIADKIGTTLPNTSQHLRLMKNKGMLIARREGQLVFYRITEDALGSKCQIMTHPTHNP